MTCLTSIGVQNCVTNKSRKSSDSRTPRVLSVLNRCRIGDAVGAWHGCGQGPRSHAVTNTVVSDLCLAKIHLRIKHDDAHRLRRAATGREVFLTAAASTEN